MCRFFLFLTLISILLCDTGRVSAADPTVAFFYGKNAPLDELRAFDVVVVEPGHGWDPQQFKTANSEMFAYVSVGELDPQRSYASQVPATWRIGENKAWSTQVLNQAQPEWPQLFSERIVAPLWEKGYRGFFLDTLDSYHHAARTPEEKQQQEQGLITVIRTLKAHYPDAKLIFNRGFEILPQVYSLVYAVAAESLLQRWDPAKKIYTKVPDTDYQWLLAQLQKIQTDYHLPVIVLDYVPPHERVLARETAKKISALGIIPWVSTPEHDVLGVGAIEGVHNR